MVMSKKCQQCGCELEDDALFCVQCGAKQDSVVKCPKCGHVNPAEGSQTGRRDPWRHPTVG